MKKPAEKIGGLQTVDKVVSLVFFEKMRCVYVTIFFKKPIQFVFWGIYFPEKLLNPRQSGAKPRFFKGVLGTPLMREDFVFTLKPAEKNRRAFLIAANYVILSVSFICFKFPILRLLCSRTFATSV